MKSAIIHAILLLFVFIALFPIYLMFNAALKTSAELFQSFLSLPKDPQFENLAFILNEQGYKGALYNSMILSTSSMILTTVISVLAGYGFAVYRFVGKQWLMPMSVRIIDFMGRFTFKYDMIATTTVILFTPILILYLITQRSFHRGITFGALKD